MISGKEFKELRVKSGYTAKEVANILGVAEQTISKYENDIIRNISSDKIETMAKLYGVSPSYIMKWNDNKPNRIKVYGTVPAGIPIEAIEDVVDWEDIPKEWLKSGHDYIGLRVVGSSMFPKYVDGDTIIVRLQPDCESGQDAVVYVNGYDATLKKVVKQQDGIMLQPLNPEFIPTVYPYNEGECGVKILGVVVEIRRKV